MSGMLDDMSTHMLMPDVTEVAIASGGPVRGYVQGFFMPRVRTLSFDSVPLGEEKENNHTSIAEHGELYADLVNRSFPACDELSLRSAGDNASFLHGIHYDGRRYLLDTLHQLSSPGSSGVRIRVDSGMADFMRLSASDR
jgi:hypothetical protein